MTRSTVRRLTKPLDEPEREFRRLRRAAWRMHQNESITIARRNLFDDEASSSNNTRTKSSTLLKTLREYSPPDSSGFQNPIILPAKRTRRIVDSRDILLIQGTCTFQGLRSEDPLRHIKHYLSIVDTIQADGATRDTSRLPGCTSSLRDMILQFKQGDDESIKGAWIRFQNLIKQVPYHGIQKWLLVQIFYDNISLDNRMKLDQFAQFRLNSLIEEEGWNQIEEYVQGAWIRFQNLIKQIPYHGIQKWLLVQIFYDNISLDNRMKLDQFAQFRFNSLIEEEGWNQIEEYVQHQDDLWDDLLPSMNVSSILEAEHPTFRGRLKMACKQISYLKTPTREIGLKNPFLICDFCEGAHRPISAGNNKRKEKGEDDSEWVVRNKFDEELANLMLEKKFHTKGIEEMLDQHYKEMHEKFSQILSTVGTRDTNFCYNN
ncbi:hypothetical protein Tco_1284923 [Tanacetum coccineum]